MFHGIKCKKQARYLCLIGLLALFNVNAAFGVPIYSITRSTTNIGGGQSLSTNYSITSSIGNTAVGPATSASFSLNSGFLLAQDLDSDGDGIADSIDNCVLIANSNQLDTDADTLGDVCDSDDDNDGLDDLVEASLGTNPLIVDSDGDGLSDFDEVNADSNPGNYQTGVDTNPNNPDTDGDSLLDGADVLPLIVDKDGDLAPYGNPDGRITAADLLMAQRIMLGDISPTVQDINHGDIFPTSAPDGVINLSDVLLLKQLVNSQP